jgi:Tfp pilus assembly protein PilF
MAPAQDRAKELTPELRARLQWEAGYVLHQLGEYERAVEAYRASIADRPTAEAHTFLGWSLSYLGRIDEAIVQCKIAIQLDPDFGNPYNDIGVYLLERGQMAEAIPWLEKAIASKRYCCYQFPHANLGRILLMQGRVEDARRAFQRALEYDPHYLPALLGLELIRRGGLQGL